MSVGVLDSTDLLRAAVQPAEYEAVQNFAETAKWSPENFAWEQIRGLVRQVFFSSVVDSVRQVVFSSAESGTDVGSICRQVAEALALDTSASVALVSRDRPALPSKQADFDENVATVATDRTPLCQRANRIGRNLWLVPQISFVGESRVPARSISSRLSELRREFEYSIVQGPAAGESSEAAALGQSADGIVLVLAASVTRRAIALKLKKMLEASQVRLLGIVLSDRKFPIPEAIYRRL